ncbi:MAG: AMP-binding protein [Acidimicrobiales bacterium]
MAIIRSPLPDVEIPDLPITSYVFEHAADFAERTVAVDGPTGRSYSYADALGATQLFAGGLAATGFGPGQTLAIMSPNIPEFVVAMHGALMAGGTVTTVNPTYRAEEVAFQLRDAGARRIVTIGLFVDVAREAGETSGLDEIIVIGDPVEGTTNFFDLLGHPPLTEHVAVDTGSVAVMPYSSGTTGFPKGVELTHRNLVANIEQSIPVFPLNRDQRVMAVLPFFHIYGLQVVMNATMRVGAEFVTVPRFDLEQFLGILQDQKITLAYLVPPIILALAKHPLVDDYDLSSLELVTSGAAPLGADIAEAVHKRLGVDVIQGYGLTETSPVTHAGRLGVHKFGTIGPPVPNTEVRLVDPVTGEDAEDGGRGEVWIRGPQVMKGYLNRPDATTATLDDEGWLHTGDIGEVDDEGDFSIVDRLKELIKYKGFQVPPAELEALLLTHPDIVDAAVIPIPDDEAGEIPKAFVVTKPQTSPTPESIMAFVAERVASYKQIRALEMVDEIPKSASGKILRRVLRDRELDAAG